MGSIRVMPRQASFLSSALAGRCLLWPGRLDPDGYGRTTHPDGRVVGAHCLAYELFVDALPDGCEIHHLCLNRSCVNPDHLVPLSRNDHLRSHRLKYGDVCKWGHLLTPDNTRVRIDSGSLVCKQCQTRRARDLRKRRETEVHMSP